jgi:hypothetical protein
MVKSASISTKTSSADTDAPGPEKVKGKGKETYDKEIGCTSTSCGSEYKDKKCYCYAQDESSNVMTDQFCAYESNGFLMACDPGCCKKQCPRPECTKIKPADPEKERTGTGDSSGDSDKKKDKKDSDSDIFPTFPKMLAIILAFLVLLSILMYTL